MKITIVNCFDASIGRVEAVKQYFERRKNKVTVIQSDYMHIKKQRRKDTVKDYKFIKTLAYKKNISGKRLLSHYLFSKKAIQSLEKEDIDLLYVIVPPNSLVRQAVKLKRKRGIKLVLDIYDLWPESMPLEKVKKILSIPIKFWRNLRDKYLKQADLVITECNLYQEKLADVLSDVKLTGTIYLTRKLDGEIDLPKNLITDTIGLCYLGSINTIINIDLIVKLASEINKKKKVIVHIIGKGESKEKFLQALEKEKVQYVFHGEIYENKAKQEIFDKCLFGFNLMKENVSVGLTMKSLDYFKAGLPILNNIKGDTSNIVEQRKIGYNICDDNIEEQAKKIVTLNEQQLLQLRTNTKEVFYDTFSEEVYEKEMDKLFGGII